MKRLTLLAVVLLLAGLTARAMLQRSNTSASLRGLDGVYVAVQIVDEQPGNITANRVETLVKTALSNAGIPVNTAPKKLNGDANLSVTVDTIKQPQLNVYVFTVEVAVTQDVQLTRQPRSAPVSARTWSKTIQGITIPNRTDVIEQAIKQQVNRFIAAYRAVNPKK